MLTLARGAKTDERRGKRKQKSKRAASGWPSSPSPSPSSPVDHVLSFPFSSRLCVANWHPLNGSRALCDSCLPRGGGAGTNSLLLEREKSRARGASFRPCGNFPADGGGGGRLRRIQKEFSDVELNFLRSLSRIAEGALLHCLRN